MYNMAMFHYKKKKKRKKERKNFDRKNLIVNEALKIFKLYLI